MRTTPVRGGGRHTAAIAGGAVLTAAAGAIRTDTAYPRFLAASRTAEVTGAVAAVLAVLGLGVLAQFTLASARRRRRDYANSTAAASQDMRAKR